MYFPHLFARRAELLALRDACEEFSLVDTVVPILEPVTSSPNDLRTCMNALGGAGVRAITIVNPNIGDFKIVSQVSPWRSALDASFTAHPSLLPGFVCRAGTQYSEMTAFFALYPGRRVALLYWSPNFTNAQIATLTANPLVDFHINLHAQLSTSQRALLPTAKAVDVEDHFNRQVRNADYSGQEFFSDDHLNYSTNSVGFGDYSVIGFRYIKGGGRAHAVTIHAIFRQGATGNIWVEHFVSDDTDIAIGTPESKLSQAVAKLQAAVTLRPSEFGHDAALAGYFADQASGHSSGLTTSKRRQIHHHIAVIHQILAGTF